MSDEEIADMIIKARDRKRTPSYQRSKLSPAETPFEPKNIPANIQKMVGDIESEREASAQAALAQRMARGRELQQQKRDAMASGERKEYDRKVRKARRRKELGQDPLPGDEELLALQEAILQKVLQMLK